MFQLRALASFQGRKGQSSGLGFVPGPQRFTAGEEALRLLSPWPSRTAQHFGPAVHRVTAAPSARTLFVMEFFFFFFFKIFTKTSVSPQVCTPWLHLTKLKCVKLEAACQEVNKWCQGETKFCSRTRILLFSIYLCFFKRIYVSRKRISLSQVRGR